MIDLRKSTGPEIKLVAKAVESLGRHLDRPTEELMLVGAAARNVLLAFQGQDSMLSYTKDVDVAVDVRDRGEYAATVAKLPGASPNGYTFTIDDVVIDVIAFGDIEDTERRIQWNAEDKWNVLGFREAWQSAPHVLLPGGSLIRVASLAAQCALKVLAHADREPAVTRDAEDLATLLRAYEDSPPSTKEFVRAASHHGYAYDLASARYLGARVRSELGDKVTDAVLGRISADKEQLKLLGHMGGLASAQQERLLAFIAGLRDLGDDG
jgi:predicted nucleotidyltransferase